MKTYNEIVFALPINLRLTYLSQRFFLAILGHMPTLSKNPPIDCAYDSLLAVVLPHVSFRTSVPVGFGPEMKACNMQLFFLRN